MDEHFKVPVRDEAGPFMMPIEGVCTIPGRGTVITGRVDRGTLVRGDQVEIVGLRGGTGAPVVVTHGLPAEEALWVAEELTGLELA